MKKLFRFVLVALLMVVGLSETASAFAQPRYYNRRYYRRPYHRRPYYRHHYNHH